MEILAARESAERQLETQKFVVPKSGNFGDY